METLRTGLLSTLIGVFVFLLQHALYLRARRSQWAQTHARGLRVLRVVYWAIVALLLYIFCAGPLLPRTYRWHSLASDAMRALPLLYFVLLVAIWIHERIRDRADKHEFNPARRALLRVAAPAAAAVPVVLSTYASVRARRPAELVVVDVPIKGLPKDLHGLRIAQLTDIHYGPFFGKRQLEYAVALANEAKPHLHVVTGDLITRPGDDVEGCLDVLRALRSDTGTWACHGNHEHHPPYEAYVAREALKRDIHYLRLQNEPLRFGAARLNLVGVDYQPMGEPELEQVEYLVDVPSTNILLCHTPVPFDRAAELGFDLTISGHTHGGQLNVPIGEENLTFVRLYTSYIRGLYEKNGKRLYVSRGLGTVGVPMRLGADPEVTLLRLCAG